MASTFLTPAVGLASACALLLVGLTAGPALAGGGSPAAGATQAVTLTTVISGSTLSHTLPGRSTEALTQPDDLASLDGALYVVFQNDVGADGSASPSGNLASTVVEFTPGGTVLAQWDVSGHADGLAADPARQRVIVTVNEDANSSLYTIDPAAPAALQLQHYSYEPTPLPHGGGSDAVSIFEGRLLVSASAPSAANGPALYEAELHGSTAYLRPIFSDQAPATIANTSAEGQSTTLALTDPDSNEVVPWQSPRFGGDFVLDSQGDQQQVYFSDLDRAAPPDLQVLDLSQSVNDTAWATDPRGTLYVSDKSAGDVVALRGLFGLGTPLVAVTPCSANSAPTSTCPAPGFPANYLGTLDLSSGSVEPVTLPAGSSLQPEGLLFVGEGGGGRR